MRVHAFRTLFVPARYFAGFCLGWLAALALASCLARPSLPPDRVDGESPSPVPTVSTFTPAATPSPAFTPTPTPSLTVSGDYDNPAVHADGRYELQLAGTRVAASFATARSPVEHWVRRTVPQPLFTIPEPFRPLRPVWRFVEGTPVRADGTPDPARTEPHRFLLRVDPDGTVHYVDDARVEGAGHLAYALHTVWDTTPPPTATSTPTPASTPLPTSTPTFVHAVLSPTPSLTVSGTYANRVEHAAGRYALQLSGARVSATFSTTRSPVPYWAREVAAPLFTVPEPFRPPYSILRTAVGTPVRADGSPDPDHPTPRRFLLRVEPDGTVHYVDDEHVEGVGHLAYSLDTVWGTTPAANDRAVLKVLDRHWFRKTLLSAVPPPMQFEVPEHSVHRQGTFPAARVGAFVTFDVDGRVTALGAPTNEPKERAGAPIYNFNGPLLPELGELHHLEHLDLGYRGRVDGKGGYKARPLSGALPPQLGQLVRLRHLDLQGQRLTGSLPPELGRLASLKHLDLVDNDFTDLPPELGQLTSLQWLNLSYNQLSSDSLPPEIGGLASLELLDLSSNRLTDLPPELGRLTSLQSLDLSYNQLSSDSLPPEIGDLASLELLNLSFNRLTDLPPELGRLSHLKWLHVSSSQLTALPPELGQLGSLRALNLGYNRLTAIPLELGQLAHLEHLYLARNRLTALPPEWGQLARLRRLDLSYNQLTGPLPPAWGQLAHLEELHLDHNQLTGPLPPAWGQLGSLQGLYLYDNQLTGPLPPAWGQLARLERLSLENNQLTGPLPSEWGQLSSLKYIYLHSNQLTGPLPPEWSQLASLQRLDLYDNQLTGPPPPEWDQLAATTHMLDLRNNQLTGCFLRRLSERSYVVHDLPSCSPAAGQE